MVEKKQVSGSRDEGTGKHRRCVDVELADSWLYVEFLAYCCCLNAIPKVAVILCRPTNQLHRSRVTAKGRRIHLDVKSGMLPDASDVRTLNQNEGMRV
jgi:hypothetical protein